MKWAAGITLGIAAALASWMTGAVWVSPETASDPRIPSVFEIFFLGFYLVPLFLVAGLVALLFLRLDLAGRRHEIATRMALGEQRSTMLRGAVRSGLRLGLIVAGAGVIVGAILAQFTFFEAAGVRDGEFSVRALLGRLFVVALAVGTATLVNLVAIEAVTRGTPDDVDNSAHEVSSVARTRSPRFVAIRLTWWIAYALGMAVAVVNRFVPLDAWSVKNLGDPGWLMVVKNIALTIAFFGTLWVVYAITRWLAVHAVERVAALLARGDVAGGRSLAADGLGRPSDTRVRIVSLSAVIALLVAASLAALGHSQAIEAAAREANPNSFLFSVSVLDDAAQPPGFEATPLDAEALGKLVADPRVAVVPVSLLYEDSFDYTNIDPDGLEDGTAQHFSLAVDLATDNAITPDALRELGLTGGVLLNGDQSSIYADNFDGSDPTGVSDIVVDSIATPAYRISTPLTFNASDRAWATGTWGAAPVSGAMLYLADGDLEQSSAADIAREYFPEGTAWTYEPGITGWASIYGGISVAMVAIGLGIAVVMIVSATATSVRLRRRDLATFAALGATPKVLRAAPVWEASALAASSYVAGALVGIVTSVVSTNVFLLKPGAPSQSSEILWHAAQDLGAVPWAWVLVAGVATVAAAAIAAAVFGASMAGKSPVEELRTADKEGVR
ncbi:FtsX-like permease family protein [Demequina oxidasica]|uniref:FtsX-like permease family protein n=1 Tax=Demequina oxidasica TaxID=676199 RepID=UPI000780C420|nr:ABC transporter permease [Demequina oxidasica]